MPRTYEQRLISRKEWGGGPVTAPPDFLQERVVVHHGADRANPTTPASAEARVRAYHGYHLSNGYSDIAYNFLFDPFGNIYVGRGWDGFNAANRPENDSTISICYVGNGDLPLSYAARQALKVFQEEAVSKGFERKFDIHRNVSTEGTHCPGDAVATFVVDVLNARQYKYTLAQLRAKILGMVAAGKSWRQIKTTKWWRAFKRRGGS